VRRRQPPDCGVVPISTPVTSFGALRSASVATLGLNPSRAEFLSRTGDELSGTNRRFETLTSLGVSMLESASMDVLERVVLACDNYFQTNPYRRWFDQLEPVLRAVGASYYDGSACHLDLVQWATNPTWRSLGTGARSRLISQDVPFLADQLKSSPLKVLLLNGKSVVDAFAAGFRIRLQEVEPVGVARVATARFNGLVVVGWSTNIQSSFGVTNVFRDQLASKVRELVFRQAATT
jgi:hypothetical protein